MELVRRTIERYVPLSDQEWAEVMPCWKPCSFAKGAFISKAGTIERHFHIVVSGVQRLYFDHDGSEHCLGFSYGNSWSGDLDSFLSQRPGRFNVQAMTESELIRIDRHDLYRLYDRVPAMDRFGRLMLEELIQGRATREIEQLALTAEERFQRLVARSPQLLQLVAQKDIASYLGMTPETFSRLRRKQVGIPGKAQ